ncbi:MAG: PAS domain-containing protein [Deltaproteobacteria bacterium]|nr:PAS domain-containing protein [Deltaproteobacteria bacterium]
MRFFSSLSLRSKIFLIITAVVLVFGLLSATFVSRIATKAMVGEIKKRGLTLGLGLAARIADPMLAVDFLRLKNMVDQVKESSDDIVYVFVLDKNERVLSHTFKSGFPVNLRTANQVPPGAGQHIQLLEIDEEERVYDFALPIVISHARLGTVRLGLSQIKAQAAVQRLLFIIFSASLGAGLVAVVLGTLFASTVTRRLDVLRRSAEMMVKGNLDIQTGPQLKSNCWQIRDCQKMECPAFGDVRRRCWYLAGTMCPECAPGGFEQKYETCKNCEVFWASSGDEIQSLAEAFDFMALSLKSYIENLKEAEKSITRQQQVLKTILDVTPDPVSLQDADLRYRAVNPAFRYYFSIDEADIIGKSDVDIFSPELAEMIRREDLEILKTGHTLSKEILVGKDNDKHWFHMVKVPVYDEKRIAGLLFTARDITEIKKYQEKLIQTVKMEELGKLAGGVAHEINTPLGIILGYAQILLEDLPQDTESHEYLEIIEKQAQICRHIVADLLNFSRVSDSRMEEMDLNQSIDEVVHLVRHIFKQDWVDIQTSLDPQIPAIRGDREKLKQVWLNLLNNAFESIGREGTIQVTSKLCPQGNHVVVSVADTGAGISAEDQKKIFEPFFSTKAPGVGTGLGLSVSLGIVREHQGKIIAVSPARREFLEQAGETQRPGALFIVLLPVNWEIPVEDACEELVRLNIDDQQLATG